MASPELEAKIKQVKEKYGEKKPESFDQQVARVKQKYSPTGRLKQMRKAMADDLKKEHIGFKKLEHKVEAEGHSEESAKKIAAAVGRKKYGAKGMAKKAAAGKMHKAENIEKPRPKVGTASDPEKYSAGHGVNPNTKIKGVSNAGLSVRAANEAEAHDQDHKSHLSDAKDEHKTVLKEMKGMKKPNLTKAEDCSYDMKKSDGEATHSHNGISLQHMKDLGDGHHAFRVLDGHHAGKWTKLHESEAEPIQKAAPMEPEIAPGAPAQAAQPAAEGGKRSPVKTLRALKSRLPEHLEKHVEGVSDEKYDRCVDEVKEKGGKYNPYAVCTASLKKMRHYAAKDKMEKGNEEGGVGAMRKMKAALHEDSNGSEPMAKAKSDEHLTRDAKHAAREARSGGQKGVHTTDRAAHLTPGKASPTGSKAGNQIRRGVPQYAKEEHQKKLGELKSMKKPNLEKSAPEPELEKSEWEVPGEVPPKG